MSNNTKNRMPELDVAKGIAILLVIALHCITIKKQYYMMLAGIFGFLMPFFFFVAGYNYHPGKYTFKEKRPDTNARNSFPSGHTATAFMCAEFLYQEYKEVSPWIGYSGYLIATATGYLRIYNDRHYLNDVVAGACIGIISTKFAYWLYPKIFTKSKCRHTPFQAIGMPFYTNKTLGMNVSMLF